jgi:hypothetical protein
VRRAQVQPGRRQQPPRLIDLRGGRDHQRAEIDQVVDVGRAAGQLEREHRAQADEQDHGHRAVRAVDQAARGLELALELLDRVARGSGQRGELQLGERRGKALARGTGRVRVASRELLEHRLRARIAADLQRRRAPERRSVGGQRACDRTGEQPLDQIAPAQARRHDQARQIADAGESGRALDPRVGLQHRLELAELGERAHAVDRHARIALRAGRQRLDEREQLREAPGRAQRVRVHEAAERRGGRRLRQRGGVELTAMELLEHVDVARQLAEGARRVQHAHRPRQRARRAKTTPGREPGHGGAGVERRQHEQRAEAGADETGDRRP